MAPYVSSYGSSNISFYKESFYMSFYGPFKMAPYVSFSNGLSSGFSYWGYSYKYFL